MSDQPFPDYVPEGARANANHFLSHYEPLFQQYVERVGLLKRKLALLRLEADGLDELDAQVDNLAIQKVLERELVDELDWENTLRADIATIKKLIYDPRMREIYQLLEREFIIFPAQERQPRMDRFFHASWAARTAYSRVRDNLEKAIALKTDIAKAAARLSELLELSYQLGPFPPDTFFNIPELLRSSEKNPADPIWPELVSLILGEPTRLLPSDSEIEPSLLKESTQSPDSREKLRATIRYAWEKAPLLPDLLRTVQRAADAWDPKLHGFTGAVEFSRKRNMSTDYIRGLALLLEEREFDLSPAIMHAMAGTATVVMDDPNSVVTYDDVRKACHRLQQ